MIEIQLAGKSVEIAGDSNDHYYQHLRGTAANLAPLEAWARANVPPNGIIIDAGGNIGLTAILLATLAPAGHVHVFEAHPSNARYLRQNIQGNGIENCTIVAKALGHSCGTIAMHGEGSSSHVAVDDCRESSRPRDGAIPMTTIDLYVTEQGLEKVDFLKIDVEGFEPAVLEGASTLITRFKPPIWMEFNTWCLAYLQRFGAREFAYALYESFDVFSVDARGFEVLAGEGNPLSFLHDNLVLHGTVEDVLLRLRPGASVPRMTTSLASGLGSGEAEELHQARLLLAAMQRSTSWQLTAPLRALRRLYDARTARSNGSAKS